MFRLLLRIQVVEIAEELVKAVCGGEHLVTVAEVVLPELTGHVALRLEQRRDGRIFLLHALRRTGQSHFGQAGAHRGLASDEGGPAGGAALLAVPVGEQRAFVGNAVDVWCLVTHHPMVVGADVELANIVTPDDQDVGLFGRLHRRGCTDGNRTAKAQ